MKATEKKQLRRELKAKRAHISAEQKSLTSQVITHRLLGFVDWAKINNLHSYKTIKSFNEVDTGPLLKIIHKQWPQIKVTIAEKDIFPSQQFDLIIVPVLAFDNQGYRLGLGGGYYDRFLATQKNALKVGLSYDFGRINSLPHEPHDIPLKVVITEKKLYKF